MFVASVFVHGRDACACSQHVVIVCFCCFIVKWIIPDHVIIVVSIDVIVFIAAVF